MVGKRELREARSEEEGAEDPSERVSFKEKPSFFFRGRGRNEI